ncbi:nucleoside 2-deoxyribosyltransferase [Candidatus Micrarchaeota archaeon]|nr:nucleoside 2-deoxyribosyltransferase [Candidatus Micrarchaeota archaeon]
MKIYLGHSRELDFETELYDPLRHSRLSREHKFVFPYEEKKEPVDSKEVIKSCDLLLAEVSFPSTGLGIEIGWANYIGIPIIAVYKKGARVSRSLKLVAKEMIEYSDSKELVEKIQSRLKKV